MTITVSANLLPQPQGSSKAYVINGRAVITSDNPKLKAYRKALAQAAILEMRGNSLITGPVMLLCHFTFKRPKSVKREAHTVRPDVDKLLRGAGDALTGTVYKDDSQVTMAVAEKFYGDADKVVIVVVEI